MKLELFVIFGIVLSILIIVILVSCQKKSKVIIDEGSNGYYKALFDNNRVHRKNGIVLVENGKRCPPVLGLDHGVVVRCPGFLQGIGPFFVELAVAGDKLVHETFPDERVRVGQARDHGEVAYLLPYYLGNGRCRRPMLGAGDEKHIAAVDIT